ncbi:MAG: hypothetical protein Q7S27_00980 [Nanoarchaeota archaeon]|nr:hypothetical protein [Nanoarchaeota archaeon]
MPEREEIIKEKVDISGIFDFKTVYGFAYNWLKDEGYGVVEEKYSEKVSGNSRDILIKWAFGKQLSDYFKIDGEVEMEIKGLTDVEVEINGDRKKMNKGKIGVEIKALMIMDPDGKWDKNAFYKFIRELYNKYVIPSRVESVRNTIKKDVVELKEQIKALLELTGKR